MIPGVIVCWVIPLSSVLATAFGTWLSAKRATGIRSIATKSVLVVSVASSSGSNALKKHREQGTGKKEKRCFFHSLRACNRAPWALTSCTKASRSEKEEHL
jgi:hypothetical protein